MRCWAPKEERLMSTARQLSFFDLSTRYDTLSQHGDPLARLATVIPWEPFGLP